MVANEKWFGASDSFYPQTIDQSLRFEDGDNPYLSRTPSSTGDRRTYTISCWVKRGNLNVTPYIFKANTGTGDGLAFRDSTTGTDPFTLYWFFSDTAQGSITTNAVFRDTTNWYHVVLVIDTTQGTSSKRVKIYVNGTQQTFDIANYPSLNYESTVNTQVAHLIGGYASGNSHFDGYMAEYNFVDGQALEPSSFGETKNGVWIPKLYETKITQIAQNTGTAIGDMTVVGGVAAAFNGTRHQAYLSSAVKYTTTTAYIGKNWGSAKTITGFILYSPTDYGFGGANVSTFTVKLYGSNSSPSNGTDGTLLYTSSSVNDNLIGSNSQRGVLRYFADTNIQSEETISNFTTTAFSYHWVLITVDTTESIHVGQIEFYEDGSNNYYGTNGFRLTFADSSNLGDDTSGNTNDFTSSGLASTDVVQDSPTNNFCTLNRANEYASVGYMSISEGNLKSTASGTPNQNRGWKSTHAMTSGKWYWEVYFNSSDSGNNGGVGVSGSSNSSAVAGETSDATGFRYMDAGVFRQNGTNSSTITAIAATNVVMVAVDIDNGKAWVGKDGTWFSSGNPSSDSNPITTTVPSEAFAISYHYTTGSVQTFNFGQDGSFAGAFTGGDVGTAKDGNGIGAFKYTPPTGFLALCSSNLPDTTLSPNQDEQADDYFDIALYQSTGGSSDSSGNAPTLNVTSLNFQPDWVIIMPRSNSDWGMTFDSNRGVGKTLQAFRNYVEGDYANTLTDFTSNGFTLGADSTAQVNFRQHTYVSWNWLANGTAPTKTYKVVVVSDSGNKFRFRNSADSATFNQSAVTLDLQEGGTYTFDVSDSTMSGHALKFSTTSDGIHGGGSEYTTGVTSSGTSGQTGAYVQITVASSAPTLYYYCGISGHTGMGGQVNTNITHGSTNFDGSIKSVSNASQTSGFSVVTYTGNNGSSGTIGHGLSSAPTYIIVMGRTVSNSQMVGLTAYNGWTHYMSLANGGYSVPDSTIWNDTAPTSTVFSVGGAANVNDNYNYVAYCFHDIDGFSKFGTYTGNNDTDGTFVYTGFRPAYLMIKRVSTTGGWSNFDIARNPFNAVDLYVGWDLAYSENDGSTLSPAINIDFLSNGFKIRSTEAVLNSSGGIFSYFCFAEQPFKFSNAR